MGALLDGQRMKRLAIVGAALWTTLCVFLLATEKFSRYRRDDELTTFFTWLFCGWAAIVLVTIGLKWAMQKSSN